MHVANSAVVAALRECLEMRAWGNTQVCPLCRVFKKACHTCAQRCGFPVNHAPYCTSWEYYDTYGPQDTDTRKAVNAIIKRLEREDEASHE